MDTGLTWSPPAASMVDEAAADAAAVPALQPSPSPLAPAAAAVVKLLRGSDGARR